jgi:hypothetical protein
MSYQRSLELIRVKLCERVVTLLGFILLCKGINCAQHPYTVALLGAYGLWLVESKKTQVLQSMARGKKAQKVKFFAMDAEMRKVRFLLLRPPSQS